MKKAIALLLFAIIIDQAAGRPCGFLWEETMCIEDTEGQQENAEIQKESSEEAVSVIGSLTAPSAFLMEASTGAVIMEKAPDERRAPASVTKIMTLILIFDALEKGMITLEDEVITSEYAASMGGSQVFLEPGEIQTVDTMIKCIAVASANDACVAMAELICGDAAVFAEAMNERARNLGMSNTHFSNCNGLDEDNHYTTARDIAVMSRELITKYPQVKDYCRIWMEDIIHVTKKGQESFGLTNTNKLIRHYQYATGLKTGSTSQAGFCVSATAQKGDLDLIAVIMGAESGKVRVKEAMALLNYGFAKCRLYKEEKVHDLQAIRVQGGGSDDVRIFQKEPFTYVDVQGRDLSGIVRKEDIDSSVEAPVKKGQRLGEVGYYIGKEKIGCVDVLAGEDVKKLTYKTAFMKLIRKYTM